MSKKKVFGAALIVFSLVLALALGSTAFATDHPSLMRAIVFTESKAAGEAAAEEAIKNGGVVLKLLGAGRQNGLVVCIPESSKGSLVRIQGVVAVEPDLMVQAVGGSPPPVLKPAGRPQPPQPPETLPWGVDRIDADLVWDVNGDLATDENANVGGGVNVAVIDSGIDRDHPDLVANLAGGMNFVGKGPLGKGKVDPGDWNDYFGHGTHVAGICGAVDNEIGVIGAGPGIRLWAVRVLNARGSGYLSDFIDGIYWSADNGMAVINMSLGVTKEDLDQYPNDRQALEDAVNYAYSKGVLVAAAAGNEGNGQGTGDNVIYPARFDSVMAVAATDQLDARASWSSTGPAIEVAAPGVDVISTLNDGYYYVASGTSMASPHVAGTAALVIASGRAADGDDLCGIANEVRELINTAADDLGIAGRDEQYGCGLVDAQEAATGVQSP